MIARVSHEATLNRCSIIKPTLCCLPLTQSKGNVSQILRRVQQLKQRAVVRINAACTSNKAVARMLITCSLLENTKVIDDDRCKEVIVVSTKCYERVLICLLRLGVFACEHRRVCVTLARHSVRKVVLSTA